MSSQKPLFAILDAAESTVERAVLGDLCEIVCYDAKRASDIPESVADAVVVEVWHTIHVDAALLARLTRCQLIVRMGVGYDNVDVAAAGRLGIAVANVPDYGTEEVADAALWHILGLFRQCSQLSGRHAHGAVVRGCEGIAAAAGPRTKRVRGSVLGVVGAGRIGTAVCLRAKPFGFDVVIYDPYVPAGYEKALGVRRCDTLAQLLGEADCVSLHCNATRDNTRMIDAAALAAMKAGAFLVNTARGELVDEDALAGALQTPVSSGGLGGASIDVAWDEPLVAAADSPRALGRLLAAQRRVQHGLDAAAAARGGGGAPPWVNFISTPHNAWFSKESRREMRRTGAATVRAALSGAAGAPLKSVVNAGELDRDACRLPKELLAVAWR